MDNNSEQEILDLTLRRGNTQEGGEVVVMFDHVASGGLYSDLRNQLATVPDERAISQAEVEEVGKGRGDQLMAELTWRGGGLV